MGQRGVQGLAPSVAMSARSGIPGSTFAPRPCIAVRTRDTQHRAGTVPLSPPHRDVSDWITRGPDYRPPDSIDGAERTFAEGVGHVSKAADSPSVAT